MHCIQNSCIGTPTSFNKAIADITCVLAITVIALGIIGLTVTSSGPFNAIVQFGSTTNGILLGTSIFVLMLDLVWIAALCKKTKEQPVSQSALVSAIETINDIDSLSQLPEEILLKIFGYLSAIAQVKCSEVSRKWRRLASDEILLAAFNPRNLSPLIHVFDESDWSKYVDMTLYGLTTGDILPCDARKDTIFLERVLSFPLMTKIEGNAGITLLTIPKGLKFNTLVKLAGSSKVRNTPKFGHIWNCISYKNGNISIDKTYRIVITNNVLEGSRNLSVSDQKAFVREIGCEMPEVLEATVLLFVTFMSSEKRLYNDDPWTHTRCLEKLSGNHLTVGGFSLDGVSVFYNHFYGDGIGVGGVLQTF